MTRPLSWFLPENVDVLGLLRQQAEVTNEGMVALTAWAAGDEAAAGTLRDAEHRADELKRALRIALKSAFITPIGAEDILVLSGRLDEVLNGAKDAVRESELMAMSPDDTVIGMAGFLAAGVRHVSDAFARLGTNGAKDDPISATDAADAAIKAQRQLERVYRTGMSALLQTTDLREVMGRRELYRRFSRISDDLTEVAERVWYASVKET
jgi:uncharacterized protein Yka (UPF0111/DUF47 family)